MPVNDTPRQDTYWCADPLDAFLPRLFEHVDAYFEFVRTRGLLALWRAAHKAEYAGWWMGGRINETGENLKFTSIEPNEIGNLSKHALNMICGQKSQPEARAKTLDSKAQQQTVIAESLAETFAEDSDLDWQRQAVNEKAWWYGEGWSSSLWNSEEGEVYAIEDLKDQAGNPIADDFGEPQQHALRAGKHELHIHHPLDVIRDTTRQVAGDDAWLCLRRPANRFDLMAEFPAFAEQIAGLPTAEEQSQEGKRPRLLAPWATTVKGRSDEVMEFVFLHKKTKALPRGRLVRAWSAEAAVEAPFRYRKIPLERCAGQDVEGIPFGYTLAFDLLPLQQGLTAGVSALTTRVANFGVPTLWGPDGCKIQMTRLGEGLAILEGGQVKPEVLDFSQIPAEMVGFVKMYRELMATYSGINNVARGVAEGGVTAASALALLEARAVQFAMLAQKADVKWQREVYNQALHNHQDFAEAEVLVRMTGEGNRTRAQKFKASEFADVEDYTINLGNPLQSTVAGRMQLIEGAKAVGVTFSQEQYWQVMTTGRLDPVTEGPQKEMELIRAENERMSKGEVLPALISDHHPLHIMEHCIPVSDPESRQDPGVVNAFSEHVQMHEALWQQATAERPALLAAKNIPPAPMPLPPPGAMPPPGPGGPGEPPSNAKINRAVAPLQGPPGTPTPVKVQQAQPAKNPLTGAPNPHPVAA